VVDCDPWGSAELVAQVDHVLESDATGSGLGVMAGYSALGPRGELVRICEHPFHKAEDLQGTVVEEHFARNYL
jgi:hypothetical protein